MFFCPVCHKPPSPRRLFLHQMEAYLLRRSDLHGWHHKHSSIPGMSWSYRPAASCRAPIHRIWNMWQASHYSLLYNLFCFPSFLRFCSQWDYLFQLPCSNLKLCPQFRWFHPFQRSDRRDYHEDWLTVYLVSQATAQSIDKDSFTRATQASLSPNMVMPMRSKQWVFSMPPSHGGEGARTISRFTNMNKSKLVCMYFRISNSAVQDCGSRTTAFYRSIYIWNLFFRLKLGRYQYLIGTALFHKASRWNNSPDSSAFYSL